MKMKSTLKLVCFLLFSAIITKSLGQNNFAETNTELSSLSFEEYLGYVKKFHPLVKMANLKLSAGEAEILKARGAFDPKLEVDYNRKKFKGTTYYDLLNSTFKIPTWFGLEFRAKYEDNYGSYLDPTTVVPEDGLFSAGFALNFTNGFVINERMASLKKAKLFAQESKAKRDLMVNDVLFEATKTYLDWCSAYNAEQIQASFLENAELRYTAIKRSVEVGDKSAIDATEALIILESRQLALENAHLETQKQQLLASNFLWLEGVPLEIQEGIGPSTPSTTKIKEALFVGDLTVLDSIANNHPKLMAIDYKVQQLEVDKSLKKSKLLPKINLSYDFLTTDWQRAADLNTGNYKAGLNINFPLFLRAERGDLKLANLKLADANYDWMQSRLEIRNKLEQTSLEYESLQNQFRIIDSMVDNYQQLVLGEERKFELGESSLFLVNSREQKLIESSLKRNEVEIKLLFSLAKWFNSTGASLEEFQ